MCSVKIWLYSHILKIVENVPERFPVEKLESVLALAQNLSPTIELRASSLQPLHFSPECLLCSRRTTPKPRDSNWPIRLPRCTGWPAGFYFLPYFTSGYFADDVRSLNMCCLFLPPESFAVYPSFNYFSVHHSCLCPLSSKILCPLLFPRNNCDWIETLAQCAEWPESVVGYYFGNFTYFAGVLGHQTF